MFESSAHLEIKDIDINCDVGEGEGNENKLFPLISSCNIACGGHAGNVDLMRKLVRLSKEHNIKVGAHPSYPDRENFGRISLELPKEEFLGSIRNQLRTMMRILNEEDGELHHIKPHGALYNDIAKDREKAELFLEAISAYRRNTKLFVPYKSIVEEIALSKGWELVREAFGDRNYNDDLSLVSRKDDRALIEVPFMVLDHIVRMVNEHQVKSVTGNLHPMKADTICIHGDTPTALQILEYLSTELSKHQIRITK
ncbi:MAG: 5-oxoprolinase subunit PxpA [Flavobacteriaceae bacterium]